MNRTDLQISSREEQWQENRFIRFPFVWMVLRLVCIYSHNDFLADRRTMCNAWNRLSSQTKILIDFILSDNYLSIFLIRLNRINMERDEAIMGPRTDGICERHVEYHWLYNEFTVRGHCCSTAYRIPTGLSDQLLSFQRSDVSRQTTIFGLFQMLHPHSSWVNMCSIVFLLLRIYERRCKRR